MLRILRAHHDENLVVLGGQRLTLRFRLDDDDFIGLTIDVTVDLSSRVRWSCWYFEVDWLEVDKNPTTCGSRLIASESG